MAQEEAELRMELELWLIRGIKCPLERDRARSLYVSRMLIHLISSRWGVMGEAFE